MKIFLIFIIILNSLSLIKGQEKKILFIGLDGCRADALNVANTPNMDELIENGLFIDNALCSINGQPTYSGPGWSSMITGVWYDKHGVSDNSFLGANFEQYSPFNILLSESENVYHTASFIMWTPIHYEIFNETMNYHEIHTSYDGNVAQGAADYILLSELDILFLDFDHIDHTGHSFGFGTDIPEYLNTIEDVDEYIGWVITAMENRLNFENEEWLIIITSDHGGNISGHGGQSIEERTIPIILSNNSIDELIIPDQAYIVDIIPTLMQFLEEEIDCSWELDGIPIELNNENLSQLNFCPTCPSPLNLSKNQSEYSITLAWEENMLPGYTYFIYRNEELLVQLDGNSFQYIDYPFLIGEESETELVYSIILKSNSGEIICDAHATSELAFGINLLNENFDSLELFPASDEGFVSDGGCTDAIPQDILGWTHEPPINWTIDNSQMPESGTLEWRGWAFASKTFWVMAEDQLRSQFLRGIQNVAVVDPDEWDDCNNGSSNGNFNSILISPLISVSENNTILLSFDSHYRNESPQEAFFTSIDSNGNEEILLHYSNDINSDNIGEDRLNEHIVYHYENSESTTLQFKWKMLNAANNWYWAIDNINIQIMTPAIGDINDDGIINILDIISIVNFILLESDVDEIIAHISDVNNDGLINILDIILIVNKILN